MAGYDINYNQEPGISLVSTQADHYVFEISEVSKHLLVYYTYVPACYTLTYAGSPDVGGSVSATPTPNCGADRYEQGTNVTLTAANENDYRFTHWQGDTTSTVPTAEITMDGDKNVVAVFEEVHQPDPNTRNVALNKTVTVSAGVNPQMAVDGNPATGWNARDGGPQWIEVDLGEPYPLHLLRLRVNQLPDGKTTHNVHVSGPDKNFTLLHTFEGFTAYGDWITYKPVTPLGEVQHVRIETPSRTSWIAWFEIEVYSPEESQLSGDINADGTVNIFDLQILISMILHSTQPNSELYALDWWERGDLNEDGTWNVFDLQRLIQLIIS
ncbi:MAG: discoidin domain-containing protein [Chloroflexota bacterium]